MNALTQEAIDLAVKIADSCARSDIECHTLPTINRRVWWYDIATADEGDREHVADAVRYLDLRNLIMHHKDDPKIVRFRRRM